MESLFEKIVPAKAVGIKSRIGAEGQLELVAPLEANLNDKETAFAGSISSMLTLAGWGAITLKLKKAGIEADVMIAESRTRYLRPARSELQSSAKIKNEKQMFADLDATDRARVSATCELTSGGELCAVMTADFALFVRS